MPQGVQHPAGTKIGSFLARSAGQNEKGGASRAWGPFLQERKIGHFAPVRVRLDCHHLLKDLLPFRGAKSFEVRGTVVLLR